MRGDYEYSSIAELSEEEHDFIFAVWYELSLAGNE